MKLFRVVLPAITAFILLVILFAWVHQTALASVDQPVDLRTLDSWRTSAANAPQASGVISKVLPAGDSYVHGLIYYNDGSGDFLYASTRTAPARILKIDPNTLDVVATATLPVSYDDGEDIVAANNYIWVILYTEPAALIRVRPDTLAWNIALKFTGTTTMGAGESLDYAFNYLWVGGRDHLARVDISNTSAPTYTLYDLSHLNLGTSNSGLLGSLAHDGNNGFLWGTYKQHEGPSDGGTFYASTVVKMDPSDPAGSYSSTELTTDTPDDSVFTGGAYFAGGEGKPNQTASSDIYKFSSDPSVYTVMKAADSASYGLFVNPNEPQFVWGAYVASPGIIKKFNANAAPVFTATLPTDFNDPNEIVFDGSGNVFVSTWQTPTGIVKYTSQFLTSDVRIGASDTHDYVFAGMDITYTLTITNDGPLDATGVLVTDTLPSQVNFISSLPGSPTCSISSGTLSCAIGNLNAHSSRQVVILAKVKDTASGSISNSAEVSSTSPDPNQSNNTVQETTTVYHPSAGADLQIGVDSFPNPVKVGQSITYTLAITNSGPANATGVSVINTLPAQVSFLSSKPGSPNCSHSGSSVTCNLGQLNAAGTQKVVIVAKVSDLASGNSLHDSATVSAVTPDPNRGNNSASIDNEVYDRLLLPIVR